MTSPVVNVSLCAVRCDEDKNDTDCRVEKVARYSALIGGIGYGIFHRRTLQKREDAKAASQAKKHEEKVQADKKRAEDQQILAAVRGGGGGGGELCKAQGHVIFVAYHFPTNSRFRS